MIKPPGLHRAMTKGDDGKKRYRPIIVKAPINPRSRMVHSQVQRRLRREQLRSASRPARAPQGPIHRSRAQQGLLGWLTALWAKLRGNSLPWDERRRTRERRRARLMASKAARPSRDLVRRVSRAAGDAFQRKT